MIFLLDENLAGLCALWIYEVFAIAAGAEQKKVKNVWATISYYTLIFGVLYFMHTYTVDCFIEQNNIASYAFVVHL